MFTMNVYNDDVKISVSYLQQSKITIASNTTMMQEKKKLLSNNQNICQLEAGNQKCKLE